MKKLIALLMILIMTVLLFGCGGHDATTKATEKKVYSETLPLGGNAGDASISGAAFGEYKEIDVFGSFSFTDEVDEEHLYHCEDCDTPYIAVFRWDKNGQTLEEAVKTEADIYSDGFYLMIEDKFANASKEGYVVCTNEKEGQFYYIQCIFLEDGDDFVEIDYYCKATEVQLGDSNKYVWLPAGGEDTVTDDDKAHDTYCYLKYDDSYYWPSIWAGKFDFSIDYAKWYWSYDEIDSEDFPFTEEEYEELLGESVGNSEYNKVYETFGYEVEYEDYGEINGCDYGIVALKELSGEHVDVDISIMADGVPYNIWLRDYNVLWPTYIGSCITESIHSK